MNHFRRYFLSAVIPFLLCSCGEGVSGRLEVLSGAVHWHNREWNDSTASFLKSADSPDENISDYALYGLALSYSSQNELTAAVDRFSSLLDSAPDKLRSAAWYQKGVCEYRMEKYQEAAASFRKSLEIEPSRTDAKINLELALAKNKAGKQETSSAEKNMTPENTRSGAGNAFFSFIRKKEETRWKKSGESTTHEPVPDY